MSEGGFIRARTRYFPFCSHFLLNDIITNPILLLSALDIFVAPGLLYLCRNICPRPQRNSDATRVWNISQGLTPIEFTLRFQYFQCWINNNYYLIIIINKLMKEKQTTFCRIVKFSVWALPGDEPFGPIRSYGLLIFAVLDYHSLFDFSHLQRDFRFISS